MSLYGIRYVRRYIHIVFSVFGNRGVVEGLAVLPSSKCKHPLCFLLGPSMVLSSLDFSVFLCKLQSWERTALVTLPWKGRFYFPYTVKSGNSFSQHPVACGFAEGDCAGGERGGRNCSTLCLQVTAVLMPLSIPVTQFPKEIRV